MPTMGRTRKSKPTAWAKRVEALIVKHGEDTVLSLLCITRRTLKGWRYGEWPPSLAHQRLLELAEKGML